MSRAEEFNVDDVVIGHSFKLDTHREGARGTIMEPLQYRSGWNETYPNVMWEDYRYLIHWDSGGTAWVAPKNLRKPPEEFNAATLQEAADLIARLTRVHAFEKVGKA